MKNRREEDEKTKSEKAIHGKCDEELVEVEYDGDEEVIGVDEKLSHQARGIG